MNTSKEDDKRYSIGSTDEKKTRKRRKKLQLDICTQVEFYFSDPNLRKDRFLNQEILKSPDGYVPIELIASFNMIQRLTDDHGLVVKAMERSKLLEVNSDATQVRRKKLLEEPKYNPDDCTVYVECLPKSADIAWIQKTFKYCGNVVYVSLPRYKSTGDSKCFAFVEYETPDEAQRACQILNNPLDDYGPPGMFPKTRKGKYFTLDATSIPSTPTTPGGSDRVTNEMTKADEFETIENTENGKEARAKMNLEDDNHSKERLRKRHHDDKDRGGVNETKLIDKENKIGTDVEGVKRRKSKTSTTGDVSSEMDSKEINSHKRKLKNEDVLSEEVVGKRKKVDSDSRPWVEEGGNDRTATQGKDTRESKQNDDREKCRKRKGEERDDATPDRKRKQKEGHKGVESGSVGDIQKDIQVQLKKIRSSQKEPENEGRRKKRVRQKKDKEEPQLFLRVLPKSEWLKLKDQYLQLQRTGFQEMKEQMRAQWRGLRAHKDNQGTSKAVAMVTQEQEAPKMAALEFIEGVVVRVQCKEPVESRKVLREKIDSVAPVAYVDLEDGDRAGIVRFKTAEGAETVVSQPIDGLDGVTFTLVTGDEEQHYWKKLHADRENKFNSSNKRKKRGKQRIIDRAQKSRTLIGSSHVRFDEEDA